MAFETPYETDAYTAYLGDLLSTTLSFAIWPVDDYIKGKPLGNIRVKIKEGVEGKGGKKAIRNPSGYYLFTGLKSGNYTVCINSDLYVPVEMGIDTLTLPDPKNPVLEIYLKPGMLYPFPSGATLVRGVVKTAGPGTKPVARAKVKVLGRDMETTTDDMGNFVLYFSDLVNEEEVTIKIQKDGSSKNVDVTVTEFETLSLGVISFS